LRSLNDKVSFAMHIPSGKFVFPSIDSGRFHLIC
jgi:hypothetical protein